jgi:ferredoxin-like protein FixX
MKESSIDNFCIVCGEEFNIKRALLGYRTCLECGDKEAVAEKKRKSKCTAPAYNKGAYQYVASKEDVKDIYPNKT